MVLKDDWFLNLWRILNNKEVKYIVAGDIACYLYGHHRLSTAFDLYIADTPANKENLKRALKELDAGDFEKTENIRFVLGWASLRLDNGFYLDIMTSLKGVDISFDECLKLAPVAEIDGIMVPFLHLNHLIANKKTVNRPKDQLDVIELEKIKAIMAEEQAKNKA